MDVTQGYEVAPIDRLVDSAVVTGKRFISYGKSPQRIKRKPRQRVRREPVETYEEPTTDIGLPFKEIIQVLAPRKGRSFIGLPRPLVRIKERK